MCSGGIRNWQSWPRIYPKPQISLRRGVIGALHLLAQEPAIIRNSGKRGIIVAMEYFREGRTFGLMPFDWLVLFGGAALSGLIVLLF